MIVSWPNLFCLSTGSIFFNLLKYPPKHFNHLILINAVFLLEIYGNWNTHTFMITGYCKRRDHLKTNVMIFYWNFIFPFTRKKNTNLSQVTDKLYHMVLYQVHIAMNGFELLTLVVMGNDCKGSCISNYHTIASTMTSSCHWKKNITS